VLNLARCQTFAFFCPYCIVLQLFWRFRGLGQCRNVCGTDFELEGVEILAKMMQNGKKKQMFGTGLNLALVLHLALCQLNVMNVPHYLLTRAKFIASPR